MEVLRSWLQAEKEQKRWSEVLAVYDQLESTDPKSFKQSLTTKPEASCRIYKTVTEGHCILFESL